MHELVLLALIVLAAMVVLTLAARPAARLLRTLEYVLLAASVGITLFVMCFISADVFMRYVFNAPIQGQLEGSELLMPLIVFLPLSYTQATGGHVGMDLVQEALPATLRRYAEAFALLLGLAICAVLAFFSTKGAWLLWRYDDVTATAPYFHTWPAAAAIPVGYAMICIRMYLQVLHLLFPARFPDEAPVAMPKMGRD